MLHMEMKYLRRYKLTPPSNSNVGGGNTLPTEADVALGAVSDLSSRMAIAAAARRGRDAVRQAMQRRNHVHTTSPILVASA